MNTEAGIVKNSKIKIYIYIYMKSLLESLVTESKEVLKNQKVQMY